MQIAQYGFPVAVLLLGMSGALISSKAIPNWYQKLKKPRLNPPNWIFGPVWTVLYLMIGYSGYLIWNKDKEFSLENKNAWLIYLTQLILNYSWTPVFFGLKKLFFALVIISGLVISIILNFIHFYYIEPVSGLLLLPYLAWVTFATYLNYSIWILNRDTQIEKEN